jgi:hypothetical protein
MGRLLIPPISFKMAPQALFKGLGKNVNELWAFIPGRTWIKNADGSVIQSRDSPRAAFVHLNSESVWDDMHLLYFVGYALWDYLTAPFLFKWPGFKTRELETHVEDGETWHVGSGFSRRYSNPH